MRLLRLVAALHNARFAPGALLRAAAPAAPATAAAALAAAAAAATAPVPDAAGGSGLRILREVVLHLART